jgi:hypothetical protein
MEKSLVIQSALTAFEDAKFQPVKQKTLASQREFQVKLFDDIYRTLITIEKADDIFVSASGKILGHYFELATSDYLNWMEKYPNGVAWPITVAASTDADKTPAPMRLLMMVPFNNQHSNFKIPIALANHFSKDTWKENADKAVGSTASIFFGMFANELGEWEFGAAMCWSFVASNQKIESTSLPVIPDIIKVLAESEGISFSDAAKSILQNYIFDDIGCIISSGK